MNTQPERIGVLGGTFDPIHFGHLRMALEIYQTLQLNEVRLIPCLQPVHRKPAIVNALHRAAMTELALTPGAGLKLDMREIKRDTPSYMVDTLFSLKNDFPNASLYLIIGMDAFIHFSSWHRYKEILHLAHLIVAERPSYALTTAVETDLKTGITSTLEDLKKTTSGKIYFQPVTALDISATQIRQLIAKGESPEYLLPNEVYHYIQEFKLYS